MKRFRPYLKYFRPVRLHFIGGVLAGLLYAVATGAGLPLATKVVFPMLFPSKEEPNEDIGKYLQAMKDWLGELSADHLLLVTCMWLPFVFLLRAVGGYLNAYLINYVGYRVVEGIRHQAFARIQALPVAFFQRFRSGDLLARLTGDAEILRQVVSQVSADIIKQPVTLIAAVAFLVTEAVSNDGNFVVIIALITVPLCVFPIRLAGKKLARRARHLQASAGDLSGQLAESLQAPLEIRAYNLQEATLEKFSTKVNELIRYSMKVVKYRQFISPAVEVVAVTGFTLALYLGVGKNLTLESFMAIGVALYMTYDPVKKLGNVNSLIKQGEAALDRIESIFDAKDELVESPNASVPASFEGRLEFKDVRFSYGKDEVLGGVTTSIKAGECVALIGPSGAGKSTFFQLIPRFYDVTSGSVTISGLDVREWKKKELRDHIAVVSQTPILFSGTIRENILLGRSGATDAEVEDAARKANAHDFILEQEDGYDTAVSEKGTSLSGGQRQRIAIARAFLKDAPILLLDEATSALDNESEAKIQEALGQLVKGRTTLLIAHRLSTTKIADRVIEFDRGLIVSERTEA
ncbi:ABC transporter ATP-binding protein/permease [Akkermansiaceae bacterium]|nr:ABC transporter ATP-binding protein/permease [Akkermansiaceae bacterium]MDB4668028.1 ABC transporter ATP-binding protein/permease [Akkermansiaceae bacterium]